MSSAQLLRPVKFSGFFWVFFGFLTIFLCVKNLRNDVETRGILCAEEAKQEQDRKEAESAKDMSENGGISI